MHAHCPLKLRPAAALALLLATYQPSAMAMLVASDDFDGGGSGFGPAINVGGSGGSFTSSSIDGNSFGVFSGGGFAGFVRTIDDSSVFTTSPEVTFSLSARFNVPNDVDADFKGFSLKNTSAGSFDNGELISVGMLGADNDSLAVTDGAGGPTQKLDFGSGAELRGAIIDFTLTLNAVSGTYRLDAAAREGPSAATVVGTLANPSDYVPRAIGLAHGGASGSGNDVFFDNLSVSAIPEVSPVMIGSLLTFFGLAFRSARR